MIDKKFWPSDFQIDGRLSDDAAQQASFLEAAHKAGHRSFLEGDMVLGALGQCGREGNIVHRGGRGRYWEVVLLESNIRIASRYVDGFAPASDVVLAWLRGDDAEAILKRHEASIVRHPGERGW